MTLDSSPLGLFLKEPWTGLLKARGNWPRHGEWPKCPTPTQPSQDWEVLPLTLLLYILLLYNCLFICCLPEQTTNFASFASGNNVCLSLTHSILSIYISWATTTGAMPVVRSLPVSGAEPSLDPPPQATCSGSGLCLPEEAQRCCLLANPLPSQLEKDAFF